MGDTNGRVDTMFVPYRSLKPAPFNSLPDSMIDPKELNVADVPSFLSGSLWNKAYNVGGPYGQMEIVPTAPQTKKGGKLVWVENARTLELVPMLLHHGSAHEAESDEMHDSLHEFNESTPLAIPLPASLDNNSGGNPHSGDDLAMHEEDLAQIAETGGDSILVNSEIRDLVSTLKVVYLLCQGLFAGFCFSTIYFQQGVNVTNTEFVMTYQSTAEEHRRLCYLFSVISTVGAFDSLLQCLSMRRQQLALRAVYQAHAQQHNENPADTLAFQRQPPSVSSFINELLFSVAGATAQVAAFLVTLVMSITDVRIATRDDYFNIQSDATASFSSWELYAMNDSSFKSSVVVWTGLNKLRLILACIGWMSACALIYSLLKTVNKNENELDSAYRAVRSWKSRVDALQGERGGLSTLSAAALRNLILLQQTGMERAKGALEAIS